MSDTDDSAAEPRGSVQRTGKARRCRQRRCGTGWGSRGNWGGFNIAAMVVAFVLYWPLGLVVLYWNLLGREVRDLPTAARSQWSKVFAARERGFGDNSVFNEYQQTQYDRIREIKTEIKASSVKSVGQRWFGQVAKCMI